MFVIEKNVEIPAQVRKGSGTRKSKYPFAEMEMNDSFFVPERTTKQFAPTAYGAAKKLGRKFTLRNVEGGVRVWRVL